MIFLAEVDVIRVIETNRAHRSMWQIAAFGLVMFAVMTAVVLGRVG